MALNTTTNRVQYTGNGTTTVFAYTFKIFANTDLKVYVDDASGSPVLQTLTTHYTVSGAGDAAGGNVTFVTAPANGRRVTILREVPATQATVYPENNKFPAKTTENALDKLTMLAQQLNEKIGRQPTLDVNTNLSSLILPETPTPIAGKFFRWNASGNGLELVTIESVANPFVHPLGTKGDLLVWSTMVDKLAVSADGSVLSCDSTQATGLKYETLANLGAVVKTLVDAKGDLLVGTAADTVARKAVGANGTVLKADSGQSDGLRYGEMASYSSVRGLNGSTPAAPTTQVTLACDAVVLRNPSNGDLVLRTLPGNITLDVSTSGPAANGRDQAGAFSAGKVHVFYIWNGTTLALIGSQAGDLTTGPTLPPGYTHWAYATTLMYTGTSFTGLCRIRGASVWYSVFQNVLNAGTATTETAVALNSFVPAVALDVYLDVFAECTSVGANSTDTVQIRHTSLATFARLALLNNLNWRMAASQSLRCPNVNQNIYYIIVKDPANTIQASINVQGYTVPNGDS